MTEKSAKTARTKVKRSAKKSVRPQPKAVVIAPVQIPHEQIAQRAYLIWLNKVCVAYDSVRSWLEAEAELKAQANR